MIIQRRSDITDNHAGFVNSNRIEVKLCRNTCYKTKYVNSEITDFLCSIGVCTYVCDIRKELQECHKKKI